MPRLPPKEDLPRSAPKTERPKYLSTIIEASVEGSVYSAHDSDEEGVDDDASSVKTITAAKAPERSRSSKKESRESVDSLTSWRSMISVPCDVTEAGQCVVMNDDRCLELREFGEARAAFVRRRMRRAAGSSSAKERRPQSDTMTMESKAYSKTPVAEGSKGTKGRNSVPEHAKVVAKDRVDEVIPESRTRSNSYKREAIYIPRGTPSPEPSPEEGENGMYLSLFLNFFTVLKFVFADVFTSTPSWNYF